MLVLLDADCTPCQHPAPPLGAHMDGSKAQQSYAMSTEQQSSNWCLQADSRQKHWLGPTSWSASRSSAKPLLPCLVFFEDLTLLSQLQTWTRVSQIFSGMQFEAKVDASIVQSISQGSRHAFHNARRGRGEGAVCPCATAAGWAAGAPAQCCGAAWQPPQSPALLPGGSKK